MGQEGWRIRRPSGVGVAEYFSVEELLIRLMAGRCYR